MKNKHVLDLTTLFKHVYVREKGVIWREIEGMGVFAFSQNFYRKFPIMKEKFHQFSGVGNKGFLEIWELIDGKSNVRSIVEKLKTRYKVSGNQIAHDVKKALLIMEQYYLIHLKRK